MKKEDWINIIDRVEVMYLKECKHYEFIFNSDLPKKEKEQYMLRSEEMQRHYQQRISEYNNYLTENYA